MSRHPSSPPGVRNPSADFAPLVDALPLEQECLQFFARNPYTFDTAAGLARRMGRDPAAVAGALAQLAGRSRLQVYGMGERAVYAWRGAEAEQTEPLPGVNVVLTGREQEVLALAVAGLSNRDIAQALHISEHTVKNHLSHVFQKLGVRSRRELMAQSARAPS